MKMYPGAIPGGNKRGSDGRRSSAGSSQYRNSTECAESIQKYWILLSKHVYISLISAVAACAAVEGFSGTASPGHLQTPPTRASEYKIVCGKITSSTQPVCEPSHVLTHLTCGQEDTTANMPGERGRSSMKQRDRSGRA